ncbi:HEAT repeat domain-containing protein [Aeromonas veronii]|uniref:Uncharacterized protein n=1 Tax=Aeromonas veronii TaxID=654 RepID=A0A4S5CKU4_AERVE|nr:hypothetical protein [Aeromonas veronii]THJ45005.1 hypothetical protein E8Q35_12515 [Aeromonas veronii]
MDISILKNAKKWDPIDALETPPEQLAALLHGADEYLRAAIAKHANCSKDVLEHLAKDAHWEVRASVASNNGCSARLLKTLASDEHVQVRIRLARNENCPVDLLDSYASDPCENHAVRQAAIGNKSYPVTLLQFMDIEAQEDYIRQGVAENPNCPISLLVKLSSDHCVSVRECVASNINCHENLLRTLADDEEAEVAAKVAGNINCPIDLLMSMVKDPEVIVRRAVAFNPKLPIETLYALSEDDDVFVRLAISENPSATVKLLVNAILRDEFDEFLEPASLVLNKKNHADWLEAVKEGVSLKMQIPHQPPGSLLGEHLIQHNHVAIYQAIQSAELALMIGDINSDICQTDTQSPSRKLRM